MLKILFSRKWCWTTLLVLAAVAVMARLGFWQLERLETRRAFNARVLAQQNDAVLWLEGEALELDLYEMEYRRAVVRGSYLPEDEIVLRNQARLGQLGVQLFTPLLIEGSQRAILVQRGWIAEELASPAARAAYVETVVVEVSGILRRAETDFDLVFNPDPTLSPSQARLDTWNHLDLARISEQMETPLLDVYLQRAPGTEESTPPYASELQLDLSEGPHLGYAGQWFLFALILAIGYPIFLRRQEAGA